MSMTASVMLNNLPKDASQALKDVDAIDDRKSTFRMLLVSTNYRKGLYCSSIFSDLHTVSVRFQPIGGAPILKQRVFKISASSRFSVVLNFLRKRAGIREGDGLFCYVNSVFAPGLDEGVGNLYRVRTTPLPRL